MRNIDECIPLQENLSFNIPSDINWSHSSEYQNLHIGQMHGGYNTAPTLPTRVDNETPTPCVSSTPGPSDGRANISPRSVKLGDGTLITIAVNQVKGIAVPATSFAEDINRLNQMWDDTSPHWRDDSVVKIDSRSIALIYWPEIFKKTGLWSAHKSNWTEWKVSFECTSAVLTHCILSSLSSVTGKGLPRRSGQHSGQKMVARCPIRLSVLASVKNARTRTLTLRIGRDENTGQNLR